MTADELLELIQKGESSLVQFKERLKDSHSISQEMVAFANLKGGIIIIGVNDKTGELNGLSFSEIQKHNKMLSNAANNNISPGLFIQTEQVVVLKHCLIIVEITEGINKPYKDKNGTIWVKNGSDKRRVTDNNEIARFLQQSKNVYADESSISGSSIADINMEMLKYFIIKDNLSEFNEISPALKPDFRPDDLVRYDLGLLLKTIRFNYPLETFLRNIRVLNDRELSLAGLLLFSDHLQQFRPLFTIDCVTFPENDSQSNTYVDSENIQGSYFEIYHKAMFFIQRNLRKIPSGNGFNTPAKPEIPYQVFEELLVNAMIHRNYYINSSIKVFVFPNRIEIISPGVLTNSLTVDNIKTGISISRNPNIHSLAKNILPYKGYGTGIKRTLSLYPLIDLINQSTKEQFIAVVARP